MTLLHDPGEDIGNGRAPSTLQEIPPNLRKRKRAKRMKRGFSLLIVHRLNFRLCTCVFFKFRSFRWQRISDYMSKN